MDGQRNSVVRSMAEVGTDTVYGILLKKQWQEKEICYLVRARLEQFQLVSQSYFQYVCVYSKTNKYDAIFHAGASVRIFQIVNMQSTFLAVREQYDFLPGLFCQARLSLFVTSLYFCVYPHFISVTHQYCISMVHQYCISLLFIIVYL